MAHGDYEDIITEALACLEKMVRVPRSEADLLLAIHHTKERVGLWCDSWAEILGGDQRVDRFDKPSNAG